MTMSAAERQVLLRNAARLGRAAQQAAASGDHRRAADLYRAALLLLKGDPSTTGYRDLLDGFPATGDIPATVVQEGLNPFASGTRDVPPEGGFDAPSVSAPARATKLR
jgi:hypothetical protein